MKGTLYIVSTPIGNLEDITLRALRVLREADMVLCEDTRVTRKLLKHFEIDTPAISYHEHSGAAKYDRVLAMLTEGKTLALVTDAGTPAISDPGARLVAFIRDHVREQPETIAMETVPGASAVTAALAASGVSGDSFLFLGFPPHKKGRKSFFDAIARTTYTVVFYESPHRIMKALGALEESLSEQRRVVVCRELTKLHEEVVDGSAYDVYHHYYARPDAVRGEFVVIVTPAPKKDT